MPPNMVSQQHKEREKATEKTTPLTPSFLYRDMTLFIFFSSPLVSLGDLVLCKYARKMRAGEKTDAASIRFPFRAGYVFDRWVWMEKQKKLFWVSFSTGSTPNNTRTNATEHHDQLFLPSLLRRKAPYHSSYSFRSVSRATKDSKICRRAWQTASSFFRIFLIDDMTHMQKGNLLEEKKGTKKEFWTLERRWKLRCDINQTFCSCVC